MSFEMITLRFYHGGVMKIEKKDTRGNHIIVEELMKIKSDYDTTLIAKCLSHGDILDYFVCHFVVDPVLVPHSLKYGESGVGEGTSQNSGPNASFNAELEPTYEAQENASNSASNHASANSNTSSRVQSFTPPNTLPPTHQNPTLSILLLIQLLTLESLNGGFNGSGVHEALRSFREENSKRKIRKKGERALLHDHIKLGIEKRARC
ncbi:hypothetical protein H5410_052537 [Solanum commersonii]|uniref:Uncharacterized protein n=1 Tax=Solanum commersonii TaxID=4109 RepID=A0A9J5X3W4_SOLCO|nr:hypothetical protein H5410_052537 [Solanum commersonii]